MALWVGETWICAVCGWINAVLRKRCRNPECMHERTPDAARGEKA